MKRTKRFVVLVAAAALLAGWTAYRVQAGGEQKVDEHAHKHFQKCAKLCAECMRECELNFSHCAGLVAQGKKDHVRAMHLSIDCADVCAVAARLCGRQSSLAFAVCEVCAKACDACAAECEKHVQHKSMQACAKACRDCAKECRTLIKHIGNDH